MNAANEQQLEIEFDTRQNERGYNQWQERRHLATQKLAEKLGFPIGHPVEIWLHNGIRLRGLLRLKEEQLFIEATRDFGLGLTVDGVSFTPAEIESCIRLD